MLDESRYLADPDELPLSTRLPSPSLSSSHPDSSCSAMESTLHSPTTESSKALPCLLLLWLLPDADLGVRLPDGRRGDSEGEKDVSP